ncbi:Alpha/Beta hydrolase protein [Ilyonectria robusta]|uniref:Alpha/Beta hydrolase protein n=1 Tax=Ilyonectria robusta TaxID=1079257 RepID=UPI001E8D191B|nr:Alpha/Beta hydrolase protein [Ilyonectria robusta]KAH8650463.1 Alpha/Beta hydrolase protein [Ilyonectria robusta]
MDLSKLTRKTLQVSRGFSYTYYTSPAQDSKPTLILFHGWPDTARLWAGLINDYLLPLGYGIVALDCLGYGGTSKPTDLSSYAWQHMTADAVEILDAEKLATRLYNLYPSRVSGVIMVNLAYIPPTGHFDLDAVNKVTKEVYGFDAADIMNQNLESVYSVAFGDPHTWLENSTSPGGMRKFVTEGRMQPTLPYATPDHKADVMDRFSKNGGFDVPSGWYKALTFAVQNEADKLVDEEAKTVKLPVFYWGGEQDFVCRPAALQLSVDAGLLPNVKSVTREGAHWALLEKPVEFGQDVLGWLQGIFS